MDNKESIVLSSREGIAPVVVKDLFPLRALIIAIAHEHEKELRRSYKKVSLIAPERLVHVDGYEYPIEMQLSATLLSTLDKREKVALWFRQFIYSPPLVNQGIVTSYVFEWRRDTVLSAERKLSAAPVGEDVYQQYSNMDIADLPELFWAEEEITQNITKGDCEQLHQSLSAYWGIVSSSQALSTRE